MTRAGFAMLGLVAACSSAAAGQNTYTISFDGAGDEAGITAPGVSDFEIYGAQWTGGEIANHGPNHKYTADGTNSYEVNEFAKVVFDVPVVKFEMFFVFPAGASENTRARAAAFPVSGFKFGHSYSLEATFHDDPARYVSRTFSPDDPLKELHFIGPPILNSSNAFVDRFTFTTVPAPSIAAMLGAGALALGAGRRRR